MSIHSNCRINRIRLEFKACLENIANGADLSINRIRLEFKEGNAKRRCNDRRRINRIRLEFKGRTDRTAESRKKQY